MRAPVLMAVLGAAFSLRVAVAGAAPLPGGAGSLSESYQDWQVTCVTVEAGSLCAMAQVQADPKTRQRVLGVELRVASNGVMSGALLMPFGLALEQGVILQVDDRAPGGPLRFSTCLPAGCVVPFDLDSAMIEALRGGAVLNITATANDSRQPLSFAVPLRGFAAALARVTELAD